MNIKDLLKPMAYKWRVQSFSKNKPSASCVAYIDARDVMARLDEVCGAENWQNEYYQVKDTMFCKIGIKIDNVWIWKSDGGAESDVEAKKGEASDAFKRAAVKWGIGRFLYDLDIKYLKANAVKKDGVYPYLVNDDGERIWDVTEHINKFIKR